MMCLNIELPCGQLFILDCTNPSLKKKKKAVVWQSKYTVSLLKYVAKTKLIKNIEHRSVLKKQE